MSEVESRIVRALGKLLECPMCKGDDLGLDKSGLVCLECKGSGHRVRGYEDRGIYTLLYDCDEFMDEIRDMKDMLEDASMTAFKLHHDLRGLREVQEKNALRINGLEIELKELYRKELKEK